ncbi:MAG: thioesterase family protein [Acidimicrobiia bacterium]|nr:thioesterase family protein [Acidimicrobiia bacterium]
MGYRHDVRVRYVDCDAQKVVYNAHYLTFVDDAFDCWLRELHTDFESLGWEVMLKAAAITWDGPAHLAEILTIDAAVTRWGNTSLDVGSSGSVGDRPVFESTITYVVVDNDLRPVPIPDALRSHLGV